jgi:hypothetical protein
MARKLRRRNPRPVYLACAAILGTHCLLYWVLTSKRLARDDGGPDTAPMAGLGDPAPVRAASMRTWRRPIYPYSVIRGGAYSGAELDAAWRADPVVAAHYAGFNRTQLRMTRAPVSAAAYVSYRQGNRIYWTRRKVQMAAGEALLTDGVQVARARCGNRISPTPQEPVRAGEADIDLDVPEPPPTADADGEAGGPADVFPVPRIVHEIFPALLGNWLPPGVPGGSVGSIADDAGVPNGMAFPMSRGQPTPPGFGLPLLPEVTLPPPMPSVWPIDFTTMPLPPVGPGFGWTQPPPPLPGGMVAGSTIGPAGGGTAPTPPPVGGLPPFRGVGPGITPLPGNVPFPGNRPIPGTTSSATVFGQSPPSSASTTAPSQALLPVDGPMPLSAEIPEPATAVLLLCGAAFLAWRRFSRR